jgi:hypothetical protein
MKSKEEMLHEHLQQPYFAEEYPNTHAAVMAAMDDYAHAIISKIVWELEYAITDMSNFSTYKAGVEYAIDRLNEIDL